MCSYEGKKMFRRLNALEIAEGALLADIAVIFQLLSIYLPIAGDLFRVLIFIVFTVLVLRRGLYVGLMGFCVAVFVVTVIVGSHSVLLMLIQCIGGIFLGVVMHYRMRFLPILLLGATGGTLALYAILLLTSLVFGVPLTTIVNALHATYNAAIAFMNILTAQLGMGIWWKNSFYPTLTPLVNTAFTYWWLSYFIVLWIGLCPVVFIIYAMTNTLVRLLGYDVRPFPGGRVGRFLRRAGQRSVKFAVRRGIIKRRSVSA
jgi:Predicted membrane protein (DUF2232)